MPTPRSRWVSSGASLRSLRYALRMRPGGSSGGHNGLEDITAKLESDQWTRIRIGIGNDFSRGRQVDYVLSDLSDEEKAVVPELASRIIQGIKDVSTVGVARAMNSLNTRRPKAQGSPEKEESKSGSIGEVPEF